MHKSNLEGIRVSTSITDALQIDRLLYYNYGIPNGMRRIGHDCSINTNQIVETTRIQSWQDDRNLCNPLPT